MVRSGGTDIGRELLGRPVVVRVWDFRGLESEELPEVADGERALELAVVDANSRTVVNYRESLQNIDVGEPADGEENREVGEGFPQGWVKNRPGEGVHESI